MDTPLRLVLATDDPAHGAAALIEELCLSGFDPVWRTVALPDEAAGIGGVMEHAANADLVILARFLQPAPMAPLVAAYVECASCDTGASAHIPPVLVVAAADARDARAMLAHGAADWIDPSHLVRLGPAVQSALELARRPHSPTGSDVDLLQQVIDGIPAFVYIKDTDTRWVRINRALADYLGFDDPADAVGQGDRDHFPPAIVLASLSDDLEVLTTGMPVRNRAANLGAPGAEQNWRWSAKMPIRNHAGQISGLVGISQEVPPDHGDLGIMVEERYRALIEQLPAVSYITAVDSEARTLYISPQVEHMLGYSPEEWIARPGMWADMLHPQDRERTIEANRLSNQLLTPLSLEYRLCARDGRTVWVRDEAQVIYSEAGQPVRWQGMMFDISDRRIAEEELQRSQHLFRTFMDNSPTVAYMKNADGHFVYCSAPMERLYGFHLDGVGDDATVLTDDDLFPPETAQQNRANDLRVLESGMPIEFVETIADRDGRSRQWLSLKFPFTDPDGSQFVGGVAIDLTERTRLEHELRRLAETDPLTSLANRAVFTERLDQALRRVQEQRDGLAVLFLDLDRFKHVNDSLGHVAGDQLLTQAAQRLHGCLRPQDTIARLGGDEFAFLLDGDANPDWVRPLADSIIATLRAPFPVDGGEAFVGGSIGIAYATPRHTRAGDLLREADLALYQAKAAGRNRAVEFHPDMNARAVQRLEQETALRHAIEREELELHFQPVVDLVSGQACGFEALVRWRHPERGLLIPADFLALAEETGLIVPVGAWVLETACRIARDWTVDHTGAAPYVAVNVSARQVRDAGLGDALVRILSDTGLPPERLTLEVTEHALIEDACATRSFIDLVAGLGVRLAIDNFGTGYSSFGQLHTLRIDELKIDRSFISGLGVHRHSVAVVRALAELANELGLTLTAEGIETLDQRNRAHQLGCARGQGFLFDAPLPSSEVGEYIARTRALDGHLTEVDAWASTGWGMAVV